MLSGSSVPPMPGTAAVISRLPEISTYQRSSTLPIDRLVISIVKMSGKISLRAVSELAVTSKPPWPRATSTSISAGSPWGSSKPGIVRLPWMFEATTAFCSKVRSKASSVSRKPSSPPSVVDSSGASSDVAASATVPEKPPVPTRMFQPLISAVEAPSSFFQNVGRPMVASPI